jgi:hypothetical protein
MPFLLESIYSDKFIEIFNTFWYFLCYLEFVN